MGPDLFDNYDPSQLDSYVRSGVAWDLTEELRKRNLDPARVVPEPSLTLRQMRARARDLCTQGDIYPPGWPF